MSERRQAPPFEFNQSKEVTTENTETPQSARLFKFISDSLWQQRDKENTLLKTFAVDTVVPPMEAYTITREVVKEIDSKFAAIGNARFIARGVLGRSVNVPLTSISGPYEALVQTTNDDLPDTTKLIELVKNFGSSEEVGALREESEEYQRELGTHFTFFYNDSPIAGLTYKMQRHHYDEDEHTELSASVWNLAFRSATGYQGELIHSSEITPEQEEKVLRTFAYLGGISIEDFSRE